MMSVEMREAYKVAEERDKKLKANDFGAGYTRVMHEDGSEFLFAYSFVEKWQNPKTLSWWYFVFTEHHAFHVYPNDDVKIMSFERL